MAKWMFSLLFVIAIGNPVSAQDVYWCPSCQSFHRGPSSTQPVAQLAHPSPRALPRATGFSSRAQQIAQTKANYAARHGIRGHVLGGLGYGEGKAEGAAWGMPTPDAAIRKCCFSGDPTSARGPRKTPIAKAVAQGRNGRWWACVIYVD